MMLLPILFTGIILSNGYKGIITTDMTAPLLSKGLETFEDAITTSFSILVETSLPAHDIFVTYCSYYAANGSLAERDFPLRNGSLELAKKSNMMREFNKSFAGTEFDALAKRQKSIFRNILPQIRILHEPVKNCSQSDYNDYVHEYSPASGLLVKKFIQTNMYIIPALSKCERTEGSSYLTSFLMM